VNVDVLVIGSLNSDTSVVVDRLALPGETISGSDVVTSSGGKGANQTVAAARAGASVGFVGAVGSDEPGRTQVAALELHGVDVSSIQTVAGVPTGSAYICVDRSGENIIVISPGANAHVDAALSSDHAARVVLLQNEIPSAALDDAAAFASAVGARLVVNAAPVPAVVPDFFRLADPLVVNEHEASELLGGPSLGPAGLALALQRATGARSVIVTLGAEGSVVLVDGASVEVPGVRVARVVDTTGAGDTFVGVLAARLAAGDELLAAAHEASRAAAESVLWEGARPPVPLLPTSAG
jgi:ribokinase